MDYHGQHVKVIANLLNYELHHNPDGQVQFVNGAPVDALSNPFSMTWSRHRLFVADGGANDVLRINPRTGKVTTFWVPPTVKDVPACRGAHANANPGTRGCDPVPTGVQVVNGSLYVSALDGEARGAGRIYKLNVKTARCSGSGRASRLLPVSQPVLTAPSTSPRSCTAPRGGSHRLASIRPRSVASPGSGTAR